MAEARKLRGFVTVYDTEGTAHSFGPKSKSIPGWAVAQIKNPRAWAAVVDDEDEDEGLTEAELLGAAADRRGSGSDRDPGPEGDGVDPATAQAEGSGGSDEDVEVPPRSGPGSDGAAWVAYARTQGLELPDDNPRGETIAALEAAGKPVQ